MILYLLIAKYLKGAILIMSCVSVTAAASGGIIAASASGRACYGANISIDELAEQTAQDLASACEGTDWELDYWIGFQDYSGFKLLRSRLDGGDFKLRFVFRNKRTQAVIGFKLKVGHSEEFPGFGQKCLFHLKQIIEGARQ